VVPYAECKKLCSTIKFQKGIMNEKV